MLASPQEGPLRPHALDGGLLLFDRDTGRNVRLFDPSLADRRRTAPRVLHLGLSPDCNLRCAYCYRDPTPGSRWTLESVMDWARAFAEAGTLEVVFGEGEPLLVPWFPALVRRLYDETPLGVGFTTNGLLLTRALHEEIRGCYGQIRLSFHHPRRDLAKVRALRSWGARFGVNLLVTPALAPELAATLDALHVAGCDDLLVLSYNGSDPTRHLGPEHDRAVARALHRFHRQRPEVALKVSSCFGRRLDGLPLLGPVGDCGAGDDFLSIDARGRVKPCSFHHAAAAVDAPADALAWWQRRRELREAARIRGCARPLAASEAAPERTEWRAWASNHSSSFLLVGELHSEASARKYIAQMDIAPLLPGTAQCGPRVFAGAHSTLGGHVDPLRLLLRQHGRALYSDQDVDVRWPRFLVGVQSAPAQLGLLRAVLGDVAFDGHLAIAVRDADQLGSTLALFDAQPAAFAPIAPAGSVPERLEEALQSVREAPETELLVLRSRFWSVNEKLSRLNALFSNPPEGARLPPVTGVHAIGQHVVVEVAGMVNASLQWWVGIDHHAVWLLDGRAPRVVLTYRAVEDRVARRCADGAMRLAAPGRPAWRSAPEDAGPVWVDLPVRAFAPVAALLARQGRQGVHPEVVLTCDTPLATAVGEIRRILATGSAGGRW